MKIALLAGDGIGPEIMRECVRVLDVLRKQGLQIETAGALVGGLAENASVVLGFQLLLCVAIGFYLLSAAFANKEVPGGAAESKV